MAYKKELRATLEPLKIGIGAIPEDALAGDLRGRLPYLARNLSMKELYLGLLW